MLNIYQQFMELVSKLRRKLIYSIAKDNLGIDASPADLAPDEFGCAESVTNILKKAVGTPIMTGTWTLYDYFNRTPNWYMVQNPEAGDIIISPTGTSSKGKKAPHVGHVGIVGEHGAIMSSDSRTGKFMSNYSLETWKNRYQKAGYPILFYRFK